MKILVTICIYNRFKNLQLWVNCWKQVDTRCEAELIVIHNYYGDETEKQKYQNYCESHGITYVPRNGQGFDIGAFQDVCLERLQNFPNDWDYLLWCTDDCLPMTKDFITPFIEKIQEPNIGVACMQISKSTPGNILHVRTTGFCISKEVSKKLYWTNDIKTKQDCYAFEHRGGKNTISEQIRSMGLDCVQVSPVAISPLWDSLHPNQKLRLNRQDEFNKVWEVKEHVPKVLFICPIFNMYPQIISSLICQTHTNWELMLIHNGPLNDHVYDIPEDERIKFIVYPEATGKWGHLLRQKYLNEIKGRDDIDYVVITNADNYHVPTYCEYLLKGFKQNATSVAVYCDTMIHNYKAHQVIQCRPALGYIDCAGVMVKKEVACEIGWRDVNGHSTDWTYFSDIISKYGLKSFNSVKGCLIVHN